LLVSQFTLAPIRARACGRAFPLPRCPTRADASSITWSSGARSVHAPVATGRFAADMQVALVNDGPVTFWLTS